MAHVHTDKSAAIQERYDGAFRCRLCPDHFPREDNDWCAVAERVVCDDCCRSLMMGDERTLGLVEQARDREFEPEDVIAACMQCPRLVRLVSETVVDGEDEGVRLPLN